MKNQFKSDYELGKKSEKESLCILRRKMDLDLVIDPWEFASFDYRDTDQKNFVELKTRNDIIYEDGQFYYTKNNDKRVLDSLIFDSVKMIHAYKTNKSLITPNNYFVVWKINKGKEYFYWKMNWKKTDTIVEEITSDFGHAGSVITRNVVHVKTEAILKLP